MGVEKPIEIIYSPGTWGNCLRWILDKFTGNPNFKDSSSPWDSNDRAHHNKSWSKRFSRVHQRAYDSDTGPITDTSKIVISYDPTDLVFVERLGYYRIPGNEQAESRYENIISGHSEKFVKEMFGVEYSKKAVAKEILKIKFHNEQQHTWWKSMMQHMADDSNYKFNIESFWDMNSLVEELDKISKLFDLNLKVEHDVLKNITNHIGQNHVVLSKNRAKDILEAINNGIEIECKDLDIIEQAFIEVALEKNNDCIIFPYGTNWFNNTIEVKQFIQGYPKYLKHMNPRLPWYNGQRNPFYLSGQIDKSK